MMDYFSEAAFDFERGQHWNQNGAAPSKTPPLVIQGTEREGQSNSYWDIDGDLTTFHTNRDEFAPKNPGQGSVIKFTANGLILS